MSSIFDHYGKSFFENQVPDFLEQLRRIADALEMKGSTVPERKTASALAFEPPAKAEQPSEQTDETPKAVDFIFVCYEENSVELYNDAGNISNMYVTADPEKAKRWAELSLENAKKNDFGAVDDGEVDEMLGSIGTEDYACVWVYKKKNENSKENYGICVDKRSLTDEPEQAFE